LFDNVKDSSAKWNGESIHHHYELAVNHPPFHCTISTPNILSSLTLQELLSWRTFECSTELAAIAQRKGLQDPIFYCTFYFEG
jgi:hypothetical protein